MSFLIACKDLELDLCQFLQEIKMVNTKISISYGPFNPIFSKHVYTIVIAG